MKAAFSSPVVLCLCWFGPELVGSRRRAPGWALHRRAGCFLGFLPSLKWWQFVVSSFLFLLYSSFILVGRKKTLFLQFSTRSSSFKSFIDEGRTRRKKPKQIIHILKKKNQKVSLQQWHMWLRSAISCGDKHWSAFKVNFFIHSCKSKPGVGSRFQRVHHQRSQHMQAVSGCAPQLCLVLPGGEILPSLLQFA